MRAAFRPTRLRPRAAALVVAALLVAPAPGCGKKGPPLPPLGRRPEAPAGVEARQIGEDLEIAFRLPDRTADGRPRQGGTAVILLRSEPGGRPLELRRWDAAAVGAAPGGPTVVVLPLSQLFDGVAGDRVVVQVAVQGDEGRPSAPSAPLPVPRAAAPAPPADLTVSETAAGIHLRWSGDGSGYNVYRREAEDALWGAPRNGLPIQEREFLDPEVTYGGAYQYQVRAAVPGARPARESLPAQTEMLVRRDRFPPGAPTSVRAVAGADGIRVFWFPPPDDDVAGFRLYRAAAATEEWVRLADLPPRPPSYVDADVRPGVTYRYQVSATDGAEPPNEGPRSDAAVERGPAAPEQP